MICDVTVFECEKPIYLVIFLSHKQKIWGVLGAQIFLDFSLFFAAFMLLGREHELSEHYFISYLLLIDARVELID